MTALPQPTSLPGISDRITGPLHGVASRLWKLTAARALLLTLCAGLAILLPAALVLGFFTATPVPLRIALAAITWAAILAAAFHFLRPALRRRSVGDAALTVEQCVPGLEERLSSAVEIAGAHRDFAGSPLLIRHLIRQAESDAAAVRPEAILPSGAVRRAAYLLVPVILLWLAAAIFTPRPLFAGIYLVLMPWRDQLPALLTTIAVTPGDVTIAEGDGVEIKATVNGAARSDGNAPRAILLTRAADSERALAHDLQPAGDRELKATL